MKKALAHHLSLIFCIIFHDGSLTSAMSFSLPLVTKINPLVHQNGNDGNYFHPFGTKSISVFYNS